MWPTQLAVIRGKKRWKSFITICNQIGIVMSWDGMQIPSVKKIEL